MNLLIGHDAEVFVSEHNEITSAIGKLSGASKENPLAVPFGAVQEDNVLAELNIHPASSAEEFIHNTQEVLRSLGGMLPEHELVFQSSHVYERQVLRSLGEAAMEFGCEPDFNVWTGSENTIASPYTTLRTAGGHIHFGFDNPTDDTRHDVIKAADYLMGLPSLMKDDDGRRRELYGKAGAFRPKSYGVEYRTLSNFWMATPELMRWVYEQAVLTFNSISKLSDMESILSPSDLVDIINTNKVDDAAHYYSLIQEAV